MSDEQQQAEKVLKEGLEQLKDQYSVKTALIAMINDYALKAVEYKGKQDEARTAVKRDFYAKKLLANNEEAADAIVALENLIAKEKPSDEPSIEESEASSDAPETT